MHIKLLYTKYLSSMYIMATTLWLDCISYGNGDFGISEMFKKPDARGRGQQLEVEVRRKIKNSQLYMSAVIITVII